MTVRIIAVAAAIATLGSCSNDEQPRQAAASDDFPPSAQLLQTLPAAVEKELGRDLGCVVSPTRKGPLRVIVRSRGAVERAEATIERLEGRDLARVVVDPSVQAQLDRDRMVRRIERGAPSGVLVEELSILYQRTCPLIEIGIPPRKDSSRRVERWARRVARRHGRLVVVHRVLIESEPGKPLHPLPADEG